MYQITRTETWHSFAQLLSKISDIISLHQNDALLDKNFISRWLRFVRFPHSPRISFFLSLRRQSRASPTLSCARHPLAFRLVSQICFGRFVRGLGEAPHPPRWSEVQGVPCFRTKWGVITSDHSGKATYPPRRDDPQGRRARFLLQRGETRPRRFFPKERYSWLPTKEGRKTPVLKNYTISCQKLCGAAGRGH